MHTIILRTTTLAVFTAAGLYASTALSQATAPSPYAGYITQAKYQVEQAKIQVEQVKLRQAEYRANRNEAAAKAMDAEIKRYQDQATLKQQEISMYTQMDSIAKQPYSTFPEVAQAQVQMRQLMIEKVQLGFRQSGASQAGNKAQSDQIAQQVNGLQLRIAAKQQEIRLMEMKAKAGQ